MMTDLIRAELLRLRTTRMAVWMAISTAASVVLALTVAVATAGANGIAPLESTEGVRNVFSAGAAGTTLVLTLGILAMAGEFRHGTATSTFLATPDRDRVVRAKLAALGLVGLAFAAGAAILTVGIAVPWLEMKDVDVSLLSGDVWIPLAGAALATVLYGLIGVALGALVRNQTAAVVVSLVWALVVEGLLIGLLPDIGRWLPGGAASALTQAATPAGGLLPMWAAGLLLAGYGLAFSYAGVRRTALQDLS